MPVAALLAVVCACVSCRLSVRAWVYRADTMAWHPCGLASMWQDEEELRRTNAALAAELKKRLRVVRAGLDGYPLQNRCESLTAAVKTAETAMNNVFKQDAPGHAVKHFQTTVVHAERMFAFMREVRVLGVSPSLIVPSPSAPPCRVRSSVCVHHACVQSR